jgi:hypothetical protein
MRRLGLAILFVLAAAASAQAVEKFIPSGHSDLQQYADQPRFGSPEADFNLQSDIYETENYRRQREAREFDSRFRRFLSPETNSNGPTIDY